MKTRWNSPDVVNGNSHLWHDKYSLPYTKVLGNITCKVMSKQLGIGSAERAWKDVKHIKSSRASHMKANRTEKQSIIYTTACVEEARMKENELEGGENYKPVVWGEDNEKIKLNLEKFGVDCAELSQPLLPNQTFCCWLEEWEKPLLAQNDVVLMTKLLQKYKSIMFYDPDDDITFTVCEEKLEFCKPAKRNGWEVLGILET